MRTATGLSRRGFVRAGAALAAATPLAAQTSRVRLRAAYLKSLSFSPLFLALEKKYFEAEGVELELDIVQSASDVVAFLGLGRLDLAFGNIGAPLFNAGERGINVKIVASMSYYPSDPATLSPAPIIMRKALEGSVSSLGDLKGRKIAFNTRGGVIEYLVGGAARRNGLSVSDFDVVTMAFPNMPAALTNGAIDAAVMPEPLATSALQQGVGVVLDRNPLPGALGTVLIFGPSLLEEPGGDKAARVLRALRKAASELTAPERIMSAENVAIWAKYSELPPPLVARTAPYVFDARLGVSVSDLSKQQEFLRQSGQISASLALEKVLDRRLAAELP